MGKRKAGGNLNAGRDELTGYKTLLNPCALRATINAPGRALRARSRRIPCLEAESMPTSAARKITSNDDHGVVSSAATDALAHGFSLPSPTSTPPNAMFAPTPNRPQSTLLIFSASASRSMLYIVAPGYRSTTHSEVRGKGPDPMKAKDRLAGGG